MPIAATNLDYAPPVSRALRWGRRLMRWALVGVVATTLWLVGPRFYAVAEYRYLQHQCGRYAAPPGTVVCAEPPRWGGSAPPFLAAAPDPGGLAALAAIDPDYAAARGPLLFLHWRTTPGGRERLVVVRRVPPALRESWDAPVAFEALAVPWRPGPPDEFAASRSLTPNPQKVGEVVPQVFRDNPAEVAVRLFHGQPNPSDPSHFTIEYEVDGQRGAIDGHLRDAPDVPGEVRIDLAARQ